MSDTMKKEIQTVISETIRMFEGNVTELDWKRQTISLIEVCSYMLGFLEGMEGGD